MSSKELDDIRRRAGIINEVAMSRGHFESLAQALRQIEDVNVRRRVSDLLVPVFSRMNPKFSLSRWERALGLGQAAAPQQEVSQSPAPQAQSMPVGESKK